MIQHYQYSIRREWFLIRLARELEYWGILIWWDWSVYANEYKEGPFYNFSYIFPWFFLDLLELLCSVCPPNWWQVLWILCHFWIRCCCFQRFTWQHFEWYACPDVRYRRESSQYDSCWWICWTQLWSKFPQVWEYALIISAWKHGHRKVWIKRHKSLFFYQHLQVRTWQCASSNNVYWEIGSVCELS